MLCLMNMQRKGYSFQTFSFLLSNYFFSLLWYHPLFFMLHISYASIPTSDNVSLPWISFLGLYHLLICSVHNQLAGDIQLDHLLNSWKYLLDFKKRFLDGTWSSCEICGWRRVIFFPEVTLPLCIFAREFPIFICILRLLIFLLIFMFCSVHCLSPLEDFAVLMSEK